MYIARALAEEGANLSLAARSADELEHVRAEIEALGVRAIANRFPAITPFLLRKFGYKQSFERVIEAGIT